MNKVLFFDTETEGLYGANRLCQLKWLGSKDVLILERDTDKAKDILLEADTIVVHNAFYDFNCPEFEGFKFDGKLFDTLLAAKYDTPCAKGFSLKDCLERYGIGTKGEEGASNWSGELTTEQLDYAADDVILLEELYLQLRYLEGNKAFRMDMHNYKYALIYSHNGFPVLHKNRLDFIDKFVNKESELKSLLPDTLNVNSPKQVTEFLGIPKSNKEALVNLGTEYARTILELRGVQKKLTTLRNKFNYSRIKGIFKPAQAKSGRWTCSKRGNKTGQYQNLQQIDRDLKTVFGFEESNDLYLVDADYTSLEMYTAGAVFSSDTMLNLLYDGKDLHRYTASKVYNIAESQVTKSQRQIAKGVNFGTLYGAGVEVVSIFIQTYTGLKLPINEVAKLRTAWLDTYPDIREYHAKKGIAFRNNKNVMVYTPMGRPTCAESYTESINIPAQGMGAEATKTALYLLYNRLPNVKVVNTVHDSLILEVKGFEEAKMAACILKECLDDSWDRVKRYIKDPLPILNKLEMDNIATVHKVYEGDVLWSTEL